MHAFNIDFCAGHGTDYLNLAIRDGGVSLTMGLSNGKQEMHIKPARVRFDDHQWHKVTVHRRIQEISSITSFCRVIIFTNRNPKRKIFKSIIINYNFSWLWLSMTYIQTILTLPESSQFYHHPRCMWEVL